jgi:hypothetical protein
MLNLNLAYELFTKHKPNRSTASLTKVSRPIGSLTTNRSFLTIHKAVIMKGSSLLLLFATLMCLFTTGLTAPVVGSNGTSLEARDLGTCIDIFDVSYQRGNALRNICTPPGLCYDVYDFNLQSWGWAGSTHCTVWANHACNGWQLQVNKGEIAYDDMRMKGWNDARTKSFACWRPN